jgi:hypothetical protein
MSWYVPCITFPPTSCSTHFCTRDVPAVSPTSPRHSPSRCTSRTHSAADFFHPPSSVAPSPTPSFVAKGSCSFTAPPTVHLQQPTLCFRTFSCVLALLLTGITHCLVRACQCCSTSSSLFSPPHRARVLAAVSTSQSRFPRHPCHLDSHHSYRHRLHLLPPCRHHFRAPLQPSTRRTRQRLRLSTRHALQPLHLETHRPRHLYQPTKPFARCPPQTTQ